LQRVNGNELAAVIEAFDIARGHPTSQPRVILFDTKMGKGVPFLEAREKNHFMQVSPAEWQQAIDILDATQRG
jgi:transketolase